MRPEKSSNRRWDNRNPLPITVQSAANRRRGYIDDDQR